MLTLSDHIKIIENDLSGNVASKEALMAIEEFCSFLPYDLTRDIGFESHLSDKRKFVDFLFSVNKSSRGSSILAGQKDISLPPLLSDLESWRKVKKFFVEWNDENSLINRYIDLIWMEFDFEVDSFSLTPRMFFQISNQNRPSGLKYEQFLIEILDELSRLFYHDNIPDSLRSKLIACLSNLPDKSEVYHFGLLLTDRFNLLRLVLVKLSWHDLNDWLKINGFYSIINMSVNEIFHKFDYNVYDVDINEKGSFIPKLGVECYFNKYSQPSREPRWQENMQWLIEKGICLLEKTKGFLEFSGQKKIRSFYDLYYLNSVNHIKVVINQSDKIDVKGYFGTYIREDHSLKAN